MSRMLAVGLPSRQRQHTEAGVPQHSCPAQAGTSGHQGSPKKNIDRRPPPSEDLRHNFCASVSEEPPVCREKNLGSEHLDTAASMLGLGCLLQQLGQLPEAGQLCRQCLEIREGQLGPQHAETAAALMGVGSVLLEQQQRAEAKLLLEKAVYLSILKLGEQHSQTRQARELLGRC